MIALLERHGLTPLLYTLKPDGTSKIYYKGIATRSGETYIHSRLKKGDSRFELVYDFEPSRDKRIITINVMGTMSGLLPIQEEIRNSFKVVDHFGRDIYCKGDYWLEVTQARSTKRDGILFLKDYLKAERIISFGDHLNDLSMFEVSDEKYAMENGHPELKEKADGIIDSNDCNGVARFIKERVISVFLKTPTGLL